MRQLTVTAILLALVPFAAFAHGDGASWEVPSEPYTIDVGYEPETFSTGNPIRFDFGLEGAGGEPPYTHIWVRVLRSGETLLATGIERQSVGATTLLYTPERGGGYTLDVSFRDAEGTLASSTFPFAVQEAKEAAPQIPWMWGVWFLLGAAGGLLLRR